VKLVLSVEEELDASPAASNNGQYGNKLWSRAKNTWRLCCPDFFYDFSTISNNNAEHLTEYHIELEFNPSCKDFITPIKLLLDLLFTIQQISRDCNGVLCNPMGAPSQLLFHVNKPVNLKRGMELGRQHVACLKRDGVRMLLIDHPMMRVLIHQTRVVVLNTGSENDSLGLSHHALIWGGGGLNIIDVEVCGLTPYCNAFKIGGGDGLLNKNNLFAFDLLVCNSIDMRYEPFITRYNQLAQFAFVTTVRYFTELSRYIPQIFSEEYDGVVFTPLNEPYYNKCTYKWKPSEKLTVDLNRVGNRLETSDHKVVANGYLVTGGGLSGVAEYTLKSLDPPVFQFYRDRPDKVYANSLNIVNDVIDDLKCGILLHELIAIEFKKVCIIEKMKPKEPTKTGFYELPAPLPTITKLVRTGLPEIPASIIDINSTDKEAVASQQCFAAYVYGHAPPRSELNVILSRIESAAVMIHSALSLTEYTTTVDDPMNPVLLQRLIADCQSNHKDNVKFQFILNNVMTLTEITDSIEFNGNNQNFVQHCCKLFDSRMGYGSQRYKIELLRAELHLILTAAVTSACEKGYAQFIKSPKIMKGDLDRLIALMECSLVIIDADKKTTKLIGSYPTCRAVLQYTDPNSKNDPPDVIIELLGQYLDDLFNREFMTTVMITGQDTGKEPPLN
jgi:hypothetical protein